MLAIMVPLGPPTSSGARKSPRDRTNAKVAPAINPGTESGRMTRRNVLTRARAEILRGFDERAGDVFERGVDRKKNKGRVDVREHQDDGEGAVEKEADRRVVMCRYWRKPLRTPSLPRIVFQA